MLVASLASTVTLLVAARGQVEAFDQGRPGLGSADAYETHVDGIAGVPTQV